MKIVRACGLAMLLMCTAWCACIQNVDAKTTDVSDLWWIPTESGWGIQFVQQEDTIFATLFVYGPDGKPTWYSATLDYLQTGSFTWSGTLYATTGPWFGTVPYDPSQVTLTPVGTMTLHTPLIDQGTLMYTVNGVQVTKVVERQNLVTLNFAGSYVGTLNQQGSGSSCPANIPNTQTSFHFTKSGSNMTLVAQSSADTCTFSGAYSQGGHFGRLGGNYSCASGDTGTFSISEMNVSYYDFRARTSLTSLGIHAGCTIKGYINGLIQPPPAQ